MDWETYRHTSATRRHRSLRGTIGRYDALRQKQYPPEHLDKNLQLSLPKPLYREATENRRQVNPRLYGHRERASPQSRVRESRATSTTMEFAAAMIVLPIAAVLIASRPIDRPSYGRSGSEDPRRRQYIPS